MDFKAKLSHRFKLIFPIFDWILKYNLRTDLIADVIAGCTVGVMQIPQGLAAAILAGVPPIIGLYMAFFPAFVYTLMGTSRHINLGTFAVVCIMTKSIVVAYAAEDTVDSDFEDPPPLTLTDAFFKPEDGRLTSTQVAAVTAFAVGLCQAFLGIFKLSSVVSVLLSDTLSSGFTTAASMHLVTSQLGILLGIPVQKHSANFKVALTVRDVFLNFRLINFVSLAVTIVSMAFLVIYNEIIKPRLDKKLRYPVPIELICMVLATLISAWLQLDTMYDVKCLGTIPRGLPEPSAPPLWLLPKVILPSFPIALVGFTISLSIAMLTAKKGHYNVRANQESIALGFSNAFSSFFSCAPISASLSRTLVQQSIGGKTQFASLFACAFLLLVLLLIGPFFEPLPQCVLAVIMVVALKNVYLQVRDFPAALRRSRMDATVWMGTFLVSVLWDIDYGLAAGLVLSVLSILLYGQRLQVQTLGKVPNHEIYLDTQHYQLAKEIENLKIIRISGSIHFANKNRLEKELGKILYLHQTPLKAVMVKNGDSKPISQEHKEKKIVRVVLDMSGVSFIDPAAADTLAAFRDEIRHKLEATLTLACCSAAVLEALKKFQFYEKSSALDEHIFHTVHEAVCKSSP